MAAPSSDLPPNPYAPPDDATVQQWQNKAANVRANLIVPEQHAPQTTAQTDQEGPHQTNMHTYPYAPNNRLENTSTEVHAGANTDGHVEQDQEFGPCTSGALLGPDSIWRVGAPEIVVQWMNGKGSGDAAEVPSEIQSADGERFDVPEVTKEFAPSHPDRFHDTVERQVESPMAVRSIAHTDGPAMGQILPSTAISRTNPSQPSHSSTIIAPHSYLPEEMATTQPGLSTETVAKASEPTNQSPIEVSSDFNSGQSTPETHEETGTVLSRLFNPQQSEDVLETHRLARRVARKMRCERTNTDHNSRVFSIAKHLCLAPREQRGRNFNRFLEILDFTDTKTKFRAQNGLRDLIASGPARGFDQPNKAVAQWVAIMIRHSINKANAAAQDLGKQPTKAVVDGKMEISIGDNPGAPFCREGVHKLKCGHDSCSDEECGMNCYTVGCFWDAPLREVACMNCAGNEARMQGIVREKKIAGLINDWQVVEDGEDQEIAEQEDYSVGSRPHWPDGWLLNASETWPGPR